LKEEANLEEEGDSHMSAKKKEVEEKQKNPLTYQAWRKLRGV